MQKVTDPALLSQLNGGTPAPATQTSAPGVIVGRPKAPDPYKVEQDRIYNAQEAERLRIAREKELRDAEKDRFDIDKKARDAAAGPAADATEAERKSASFLGRAIQAENDYLNIDADPNVPGQQQIGGRSVPGQFFSDHFPNVANNFSDPARQKADQAQLAFISAILRSDSGAAIPTDEITKARQQYFPMPGDSPEVIAQKAQSRRTAIEGLRESAGRMAPQSVATPEAAARATMDAAGMFVPGINSAPQGGPPPPPQGPNDSMRVPGATMDNIAFGMDLPGTQSDHTGVPRLTPQQQAALTAALDANLGNPNFGPDTLRMIYQSIGYPVGDLPSAPEFYDAIRSGKSIGTEPDYRTADEARQKELDAILQERGMMDEAKRGVAAFDAGVFANLTDELAGVAGGLLSDGSFADGYQQERDVVRRAQQIGREERGVGPEIVGGLLSPLNRLGSANTAREFVTQGAKFGALSGFGAGEGLQNSLLSAGGGAVVGAGVGAGASQAPKAVNALLDTSIGQRATGVVKNALERTRPNVDAEVIAAGQRQGIPIRLPDAVEGKRPAMAALEKTKTGAPRVASARAEDINATQDRLASLVPEGASARDETQLGKMLQSAMERQNEASKSQTSAFFKRVEKMAPGARSDAADTLAYIDGEISRLQGAGSRGNASAIKALQDMRADIAETGLSVESLQSLRASIRQRVKDNNLDPSATDRLFGGVDEAATADLEKALGAVNKNAVGAFRRANRSHAERLAFRREVAKELTGTPNNPLDAEKAATRLMSKIGSKGDEEGFGRIWASLDDAERADTAATILHNYGGGDEFSLQKLATNLENANERTLRTVFGKDGYEALRDIRLIARRKTQTQKGLNNSNTGSIVEDKGNSLLDTILGVFGYTQGGPLGAAAAVGARSVGEKAGNSWRARLLLNPDFTKWLKQTPNTTRPEVINRYFDRLNKIASREQAFLMDAQQLQSYLAAQFSKGTGRAAADENSGENGREQPR